MFIQNIKLKIDVQANVTEKYTLTDGSRVTKKTGQPGLKSALMLPLLADQRPQ